MLAGAILLACAVVGSAAWISGPRPGPLGLGFEEADQGLRISWVMPAGNAWHGGARTGMRVETLDGRPASRDDLAWARRAARATLLGANGQEVVLQARGGPLGRLGLRVSLLILAAAFALLGAGVVLRRGDRPEARWFGIFSGFGAAAIAVAPAAGNSHVVWALITQFVALTGVAVSFLPFVSAFVNEPPRSHRRSVLLLVGLGAMIVMSYFASVALAPAWFPPVRIGNALFLAVSFLLSLALLLVRAVRPRPGTSALHVWMALAGLGLGAAPFVALTLLPLSLRGRVWVQAHWTVLFTVAIPAAFTVSILQANMFGIRRFVHRGIVYGLSSTSALLLVAVVAGWIESRFPTDSAVPAWRTSVLVVAAAALFRPLSAAVRRGVDRYIYHDSADYRELLDLVQHDLRGTPRLQRVIESLMTRLLDTMRLESAVLFVEPHDPRGVPTAAVGSRAGEIAERVYPRLRNEIIDAGTDVATLLWESEMLIATPLVLSTKRLGTVVWGPKADGEVFVTEEKRLLGAVAPILALVLGEAALSDDLRELNERLLKAEEQERARLARDLHDGPLQKGIMLKSSLTSDSTLSGLAVQLVTELREVCARLRPAILDDLGLVAALDWLAEEASRRFDAEIHLEVDHRIEEDRLDSDSELALFRVAQEAINNAMKHAQARTVSLRLTWSGPAVVLDVSDDGVGFSLESARTAGLGLRGMRERIRHVHGALRIESHPGAGTRIVATIPHGDTLDA